MTFLWAAATDPGRVRGHNEDALWPRPGPQGAAQGEAESPLLAVVADGMGGHVGGEVASRLAIEAAVAAEGEAVERVLAANAAVVGTALDRPRLAGMGTTMTLAVFTAGAVEKAMPVSLDRLTENCMACSGPGNSAMNRRS